MRADWTLPSQATSAHDVRLAARQFLSGGGCPAEETSAIELVISELVTNSVVHAVQSGGDIEVSIELTDGHIRVEVRDEEPTPPVVQPSGVDNPGGRGLQIVNQIASQWGWTPTDGDGKTVWFNVTRRHQPPQQPDASDSG